MVEGQRPRTDQVRLLKRSCQDSADVLQGQPNGGVQETLRSTTALRLHGGRYRNPEAGILVRLEPGAQDPALATATELGSIPPRGGSVDRGTGCHAAPPPILAIR